jgi:hypothetical protein
MTSHGNKTVSHILKFNFVTNRVFNIFVLLTSVQLLSAVAVCVALSRHETRTGWSQTLAAVGGAVAACDAIIETIVRARGVYWRVFFFVAAGCSSFFVLVSVLTLACNTEDSSLVAVNRDEIALCFGIIAWGCQFSRVMVVFVESEAQRPDVYNVQLNETF